MRELTKNEVEDVSGGWVNIAAGAIIGGALNGVSSATRGGSFWSGFRSGAISGALIGTGLGFFSRSAVVGFSLIGLGSSVSVSTNYLGNC